MLTFSFPGHTQPPWLFLSPPQGSRALALTPKPRRHHPCPPLSAVSWCGLLLLGGLSCHPDVGHCTPVNPAHHCPGLQPLPASSARSPSLCTEDPELGPPQASSASQVSGVCQALLLHPPRQLPSRPSVPQPHTPIYPPAAGVRPCDHPASKPSATHPQPLNRSQVALHGLAPAHLPAPRCPLPLPL